MMPVPGPHLTPDELDAWLAGVLPPPAQEHLAHCPACRERAELEREVVHLLQAVPLLSPNPGFADRVMARVTVPEPARVPALAGVRRVLATRRGMAVAAGLAVLLLGSMAGSLAWILASQTTLVAVGQLLLGQAGHATWIGVRDIATALVEQPWFASLQALSARPGRLGIASAVAIAAYLVGLLALRRLLALPTQQVAHAGA
jgi:hypothetical protein